MNKTRHPDKSVAIAVLQAGTRHSANGNPGMAKNWALFKKLARDAARDKPDLIVFPEYAITGWPYPAEAEINGIAETIPGKGHWFTSYAALAKELSTPLLGWQVEKEDDRLYSASVMFDRTGQFIGKYRKVQANLGEQTWWGWSQGQSFAPLELDGIRYGISICADMWFPETVRCEELLGADIIIQQSVADDMQHLVPARAFDSEIPIVMSIFNGGSYAVDSRGTVLDKLSAEEPASQVYRLKPLAVRTHEKYGGLWIPRLGNQNLRNIEAYAVLTDPATRPPWTNVFLARDGSPQNKAQLLERFSDRYDANDPILYHQEPVTFADPWSSPYTVDPVYPHQLINTNGKHLFILNKTAWAFFGCDDPAGFLQRSKEQGVNVLRVALEGVPYYTELGIDMWPWGGSRSEPDWTTFNRAYWETVKDRVRLAGEYGIGLDVVLYFSLHPTVNEINQQRPYWQQALERLSRYANVLTWEVANEYTANEAFQDAAGQYLKSHDIYGRPICTSDGTTDDAVWPDKPWIDLAINHTCTSSTEQHDLATWYLALARNTRSHGKPAWCNESGREQRHRNDDGIHRRKQGWLWCAAGAFWTWHSWDGCEGINDLSYQAPGGEFTEPMARFFRALPFWKMAPSETMFHTENQELVHAALVTSARDYGLAYCCTRKTGGDIPQSKASLRLPAGEYRVICQQPADLSVVGEYQIASCGLGQTTPLLLPAFTDDLILTFQLLKQGEKRAIQGTT